MSIWISTSCRNSEVMKNSAATKESWCNAALGAWRAKATCFITIVAMARLKRFPKKRSEEHTSELQSHLNLVCRLLLEKKKKSMILRAIIDNGHATCLCFSIDVTVCLLL